MGRIIIKLGPWYLEWSTITDAPTTPCLTRDELKAYLAKGEKVEERLQHVDATGSSYRGPSAPWSADDVIVANRAGPHEQNLLKDQLVASCVKLRSSSRWHELIKPWDRGLHTWFECELCGPSVRCGKCGNNCCNGGYGFVDGDKCDECPNAYNVQGAWWQFYELLALDCNREQRSLVEEFDAWDAAQRRKLGFWAGLSFFKRTSSARVTYNLVTRHWPHLLVWQWLLALDIGQGQRPKLFKFSKIAPSDSYVLSTTWTLQFLWLFSLRYHRGPNERLPANGPLGATAPGSGR